MDRVKFNQCLNREIKFWNIPVGSLILASSLGIIAGVAKGFMWALGIGAIGFVVGGALSHQWWLGNLQRWVYWHLPSTRVITSRYVPPSHYRNFI